ncbi:MAG: porin family protein [Bacteroidales bacterium]|jgi:hypothetical protein|nr:porin family protein [Bacteroidales bacterium]
MNKRFISTTAVLLFTATAALAQVSFGIRAGMNMQNINGKDISGDPLELGMVPGINGGVVISIPVATDFFLQPGLTFAQKGAKGEDFMGLPLGIEYKISYIEMPVSFVYKPLVGTGHFFIGFGPYISYGIGGKVKMTVGNTTSEYNVTFAGEYNDDTYDGFTYLKQMDYGGNLFFGYELPMGLSFQINTQLGLAEINPENLASPDSKTSMKHTGFGITLGYNF